MPQIFSVAELVKVAVEDERSGVAFYSTLAEVVNGPKVKRIMVALAEEEKVHQRRFEEILRDLGNVKVPERYEDEYASYLEALTSSRAFPNQETACKVARECPDDAAAIDTANRFERDTLILMNEMRSKAPQRHAEIIEELIREEQGHLVTLTRARAALTT